MKRSRAHDRGRKRNRSKEHATACTFDVPKDENGDYILPPIRGWVERRQQVIADMEREVARLKKAYSWMRKPHAHILPLRRAIREWQLEIAAGVPRGDDEYGPQEVLP